MEDEFPKKRNVRPVEKSNVPIITLSVLVLLVLAMLYVGYEYISDNSSNAEELTSVVVDTPVEDTDSAEASGSESEFSAAAPAKSEKNSPERSSVPAVSASSIGGEQITHLVKSGETFTSIASRYNLKTETLRGLNSSVSDVKAGTTKLKVQVKAVHTVGPGDVLRVVAGKYGTKDISERGEKLIIPFPDKK
jgi:LysM repeat protein